MDVEKGGLIEEGQDVVLPSEKNAILHHIVGFIIILVYFLVSLYASVIDKNVYFKENDPRLSFPYKDDTVSVSELMALSTLIPLAFIFIGIVIILPSDKPLRNKFIGAFILVIGLFQALLFNDAVTNNVKVLVRRPRPNFFAYCNYKGYYDAQIDNNFTAYNAMTNIDTIGNTAYCLNKDKVADSIMSFPSGHTSLIFCGMIYSSMMIKYMINSRHKFSTVSIDGILFCGPLALASWVGITRIQDHFHNTDDVMMGGIIGLSVGYYFFKHSIALFETYAYNNSKKS